MQFKSTTQPCIRHTINHLTANILHFSNKKTGVLAATHGIILYFAHITGGKVQNPLS